jgi:hypothetical protein
VPSHFLENAVAAVSAAVSIVESLLIDPDLREGLVGIPHYLHTMTAFACVFLLKVAAQYPGQFIEDAVMLDLTSRLVQQFRSTAVGKFHLVHLMADGLEKLAAKKIASPAGYQNLLSPTARTPGGITLNGPNQMEMSGYGAEPLFGQTLGNAFVNNDGEVASSPFLHFETGHFDFNYPGFGLL